MGCTWRPPMHNGHIFMTGREYCGPFRNVLNITNVNLPNPTARDKDRAWLKCLASLPVPVPEREALAIKKAMGYGYEKYHDNWPSTRDVYTLRKMLKGLLVGPLDKNLGEFWLCCPCLYQEAMSTAYAPSAGYRMPYIRKATSTQSRKLAK